MPRRFRLPEEIISRLRTSAWVVLPVLVYIALRTFPGTAPVVYAQEARLLRVSDRVARVAAFLVKDVPLEREVLVCPESPLVGPVESLPVQVLHRAHGGELHDVLVWKTDDTAFVQGEPLLVGQALVGFITKVQGDVAVVRTLAHEQSTVAAMVLGKETTVGVYQGSGGAFGALRYVPQTSAIAVGDVLVTSGTQSLVPRGLFIGRVVAVDESNPSPFYEITVAPAVESSAWWQADRAHVPAL